MTFLIIAGEVSGDMRAAGLVRALKARDPETACFGIGGPRMRAAGVETLYDVDAMAVMGLPEVLRRLPFFHTVFHRLLRLAAERRPDAVVLVDYPGFNLRFAERAHALGLRTIYYICPQVWAWHRSRIPRMARTVDRLLAIFPFEPAVFEGTGLRVDFVGHPLVDEARAAREQPALPLPWPGEPRVALLPGSRRQEVERILPPLWAAAARLEARRPGLGFLVAAASPAMDRCIRKCIAAQRAGPSRWTVVTGESLQILRQARAAMVASGTATVEAALMGCPMIVVYRTAPLTYLLARHLVKVPHVGMVNLTAGARICPEFIQHEARPAALADALAPLLDDGPARDTMRAALAGAAAALGPPGSHARAAGLVLDAAARPHPLPADRNA
ncbi:MAG: lipid-A-disaccharide synthase [Lentisphaerae bacterium]|nr:lipid-A-disaccharide synthase [Lentisphaerota bacterium]